MTAKYDKSPPTPGDKKSLTLSIKPESDDLLLLHGMKDGKVLYTKVKKKK